MTEKTVIRGHFEQVVKHKAKRMANKPEFTEQAIALGFSTDAELKAFTAGAWDAMIYEVAMSLSQRYARRDYRRELIDKWLTDKEMWSGK